LAKCEWTDCNEQESHTVKLDFPGESQEVWTVCRRHDRELKIQVMASRPKAEPSEEAPPSIEVCCGDCQRRLEESPDLPPPERQPCPQCRSLKRLVKVAVNDSVTMRESVRVRAKRPGKGGWLLDTKAGDSYQRALEGWGKRELTTDREHNRYRELIVLPDGTRIESTALLSDHRDDAAG